MTWARRSHLLDGFALPFDMVIVLHEQGNRCTCGLTAHHTAEDLYDVFFDLHSSTRTVALLTAGKFFVDDFNREGKPCGEAIFQKRGRLVR